MDQPKKPTDYSNLGKAIHWFAISLGLLVYGVVVKLLVPPWATNLVALLMNLSAGFILAGLIFLLLRFFGFDLEERVQGELDEAVSRLNETSTLLNKSIGNISRLQSLEDSDLIRYCNRITDTSPDKWYQHLRRSNGPIWLMGPSLKAWFKENEKLMTEILLQKASEGTEIKFIIMGAENKVGEEIAELAQPGSPPNVGFYDPGELKGNENYMKRHLEAVNQQIKKSNQTTTPCYVQLRKVTGSPMFIKAEFFGDILHWSFFGYKLDGQTAPSFWCQERKLEAGQKRLYQIIKNEFETIWGEISEEIDITPHDQQPPPAQLNP